MSFTATFYTLSKRENSTLQPSTTGTDYSIILKDICDVLNPEIQLVLGQSDNPTAFNFCYIPAFNRYYFIRWRWENRMWVALGSVDPLASWKTPIGNYTGYVTRAASRYDGKIIDMYYPAKCQITELKEDVQIGPDWERDVDDGTFVIGVMGKDAGQNGGAVTYYAVKPAAVRAITDYLMDPQNLGVTDISDELLKCIFNPMQYIVSCLWFPFALTGGSDPIQVGWWEITGVGTGNSKELSDFIYTRNITFNIPKHPQAAIRGDYLNQAPFSSYILNAGSWGTIQLNNQHLMDETQLVCVINVDLCTGTGKLSIKAKDHLAYVEDHYCQVGVPVQLGQNMLNQGAITSTYSDYRGTVSAVLHGKPLGAIVSGMSAIMDAAALSQPIPVSSGSNGSFAFNNLWNIIGRFLTVVDEDIASRGRPLCKAVQLNTLSGFIMCEGADPAIPCTDTEMSKIISYLNSGFYYE